MGGTTVVGGQLAGQDVQGYSDRSDINRVSPLVVRVTRKSIKPKVISTLADCYGTRHKLLGDLEIV